MKIKVSNATNTQLDWLVAKCSTLAGTHHGFELRGTRAYWTLHSNWEPCYASTLWAHGGPIIGRELLHLTPDTPRKQWVVTTNDAGLMQFGSTPLIAAMRCFVTSKLGDEVEVLDELA